MENKVVSCGETVKIFSLSNFQLQHEFHPPPSSSEFTSVSWNKDGDKFVSVPSLGSKLIFSEFHRSEIFNSEVNIGVKVSCAKYDNANSRYLALGTGGGEVLYWDTHHSKIEKTFCSKDSEITSLVFGSNNHLAFGTLLGDVYLYSLKNHISSGPLKADHIEHIRDIDFKKGKLVSVSDDGSVNLWDTNSNKLVHSFDDCHKAPAMAVKFLLPNLFLAVSVGLDKKIFVLDMRAKKHIRSFTSDQPLRCLDVLCDGVSILVGGSKGDIQRYNIQSTAPGETFHTQNGPVKSLAINKVCGSSLSKTKSTVTESKKLKYPERKENRFYKPDKAASQTDQKSEYPRPKHLDSESSSSTCYNSSSSNSYDFPLVVTSKEPLTEEPFLETPDSDLLDVNAGSLNVDIKNEANKNPVDELINYLAANSDNPGIQSTIPTEKSKALKEPIQENLDIIISHVTESIKEAKNEMHLDQVYLFTQMIKHFVDLKDEVRELREKCESNKNMQEELYKLREENCRLKAAF